jgi:hypothetical protein
VNRYGGKLRWQSRMTAPTSSRLDVDKHPEFQEQYAIAGFPKLVICPGPPGAVKCPR